MWGSSQAYTNDGLPFPNDGLPFYQLSHFLKVPLRQDDDRCADYDMALRLEELQKTLADEKRSEFEVNLVARARTAYHQDLLQRWNAFADAQLNNERLTSIKIHNIQLPPAPFFKDKLLPILNKNQLTSLELRRRVSGTFIRNALRVLEKRCGALVALDLASNKTQIKDMADYQLLSKVIGNHPSLSYVNLSDNGLGENVDHLALVLKGSDKLESLILDSNSIASNGLDLIIEHLKTNKTLTTLSLSDNLFGPDGAKALAKTFQNNDDMELRELDLSLNGLTLGSKVESKVLCDTLLHIDLQSNQIKLPGMRNIVAYLEGNPPLACLNLAGNTLRNNVAPLLMGALKRNTNLAHLNLKHNSFTKASVPCIVDALKNNSTLLTLNLSDNKIMHKSGGRAELVKNALYDTTSLQTIIESNHSCQVYLSDSNYGTRETHEVEVRKMNAFGSEGKTIRYKLVLAMFTLKAIPFNPHSFQHLPLELMPRLLEFVQQEMGYKGFGKGIWRATRTGKGARCLTRVYEVITGWSMLPSLFERGPGKVKKKRKKATKKRKWEDDEDWIPGKKHE